MGDLRLLTRQRAEEGRNLGNFLAREVLHELARSHNGNGLSKIP